MHHKEPRLRNWSSRYRLIRSISDRVESIVLARLEKSIGLWLDTEDVGRRWSTMAENNKMNKNSRWRLAKPKVEISLNGTDSNGYIHTLSTMMPTSLYIFMCHCQHCLTLSDYRIQDRPSSHQSENGTEITFEQWEIPNVYPHRPIFGHARFGYDTYVDTALRCPLPKFKMAATEKGSGN